MKKKSEYHSLTFYGHFRSSCSIATALLQRKQTFALVARPARGRYHPSTFNWCSASSAEVFPNTLELWTVWQLFTTETTLTACSLEHALCICPPQLYGSLSSSRKEQLHPLSLSRTPYIQQSHVFIWAKLLLWVCLHGAQSHICHAQSIISPSCDACAQSFPSAPSTLQDPVSQCPP